jgi:hypothetical protein
LNFIDEEVGKKTESKSPLRSTGRRREVKPGRSTEREEGRKEELADQRELWPAQLAISLPLSQSAHR